MKKFLTLRNVIICSAAFIGLLFFFLSFAVSLKGTWSDSGVTFALTFKNAIWGCKEIVGLGSDGRTYTATISEVFAGIESAGLNVLGFLGVLFPLLGAIAAGVILFVVKNEKIRKFALIGVGFLFLLGGIFQFLVVPGEKAAIVREMAKKYPSESVTTFENYVNTMFNNYNVRLGALSVISGIFTILAGCAVAASHFIPEKNLVK